MSSYSLSSKHNFAEVYKGCTNAKILKDIKDIKKKSILTDLALLTKLTSLKSTLLLHSYGPNHFLGQ